MIVDTDVLIWYFRGSEKARKALQKHSYFSISAVTYMELLQGIKNKKELKILKHFFLLHEINNISLDNEITSRAIYFLERFNLSHGLLMADALIAATADVYGDALLTGNYSHYKMIPGIEVKRYHP